MEARKTSFSRHPNFRETQPDPDLSLIVPQCIDVQDRHYCSAKRVEVGLHGPAQAMQFVLLQMAIGRTGLHVCLTPEGARQLAEAMLACAADLDRQLTERTNAQLAATLRKAPCA